MIDNRRGSVMAIVSLAQLLGEDRMWEFFSGHLTASQEKLVAVYIERSKRVSGGGGGGAVMNIANVATPQHFNSSASSSRVL